MRKVLLAAAVILALLVVVVLVRALLHRPEVIAEVATVSIDFDDGVAGRHLSEAVRFRTISPQDPADFDPVEFLGFIDWVRTTYPEVDQTMELELLGGYTMLYRWQGSDEGRAPILLTGHYDVVPVIPGTEAQWEHPPFGGRIADDVIWGRGTLDDKSGVIAQLEAATFLVREGFRPARTIYFSFGHDEELGGSDGAARVAAHLAEQRIELDWSLDEGSFVYDGLLPGVEPLFAAINVAEKGSVTLNIVAKAAGGHSSMPPRETAVGRLATAITELEDRPLPGGLTGLSEKVFDTASRHMPFTSRMAFANRWLFGGIIDDQISGLTFGNAMLRTTIAPTMLSASVKVNVLPVEATATVNFRIHPRDTVDDVIAHVKSVVENEHVEVRRPAGSGRPASSVSDWESAGYEIIAHSLREVYGDVVVTPGLMIAGSDTRHYGKVARNAFRFNPMVVTQDDLAGFHGTNERISVANLGRGVRTYVQIIRNGSS